MKKVKEIKAFRGVRMNLDVAPELAQPNEVREVYNMIEDALSGKISNMKGFENVLSLPVNTGFAFSLGANKCIGTCRDVEGSSIIYFILNDSGNHGIVSMDTVTKHLTWVLKDEPLLNFKTGYKVKANVIQGLLYWTDGYFGSFLNSDFNPPRKVNIAKAVAYTEAVKWAFQSAAEAGAYTGNQDYDDYTVYISSTPFMQYSDDYKVVAFALDGINRKKEITGYGTVVDDGYLNNKYFIITTRPWQLTDSTLTLPGHIMVYQPDRYFGIDWQVMDRIKYPPKFAPTTAYESDVTVTSNNLRNNLFQFAYRYVYDDNEKSVFSPKSEVPLPTTIGLLNGSFFADETIDNNIRVWMDSGSIEVKSIELAVRDGNIGNWFIIHRKHKYDDDKNIISGGDNDIFVSYNFFNTELGEPIDQIDATRPYDAVPQVSNQQGIFEKNRLLDGDYWQDYNNLNIDVSLVNIQTEAQIGRIGGEYNTWVKRSSIQSTTSPFNQFTAGEIYLGDFWEPGFTYIFDIESYPHRYDDPNNAIQNGTIADVYGEFADKIINSQAVVDCPIGMSFEDFSNTVVANLRNGNLGDSSVIALNNYNYKGFFSYTSFITAYNGTWNQVPAPMSIGFIIQTFDGDYGPCVYCADVSVNIVKVSSRAVFPTFKSGAKHPFGIMYFDRASRFGAVNKSIQSEIYVPAQIDGGLVHELYKNQIKWSINHVPPDWATHYAWCYAKNSSVQYSLFATISSISDLPVSNSVFICVNQYIVDQNELISKFNVPVYEWKSGDRIRFIANKESNSTFKTIPYVLDYQIDGIYVPEDDMSGSTYLKNDLGNHVLDANGNKVKDPKQIGIIVSKFNYNLYGISVDDTIVEIYRPKKSNTDDTSIFYQFETVLNILNPHTESRAHEGGIEGDNQVVSNGVSIKGATGQFKSGDSYIRLRIMENLFPCESFSFSDYFDSEVISIGAINSTDSNVIRTRYISKLIYSGRLIQNTRVNDLSRVDASDSFELADKYGAIHHIEEVGDMVKVLQKSKVSHLLVGRAGVTQPNEEGTQIMSSTKDVLGTLILQKSEFGTQHSGSVVRFENRLYWFDFDAASICRDPGNGIQNLTETFGLKRFMEEKVVAFGSADNLDVVSGYDQANEIVWWTFADLTTAANSFTIGFRDTGGRTQDGFVLFTHALPDFYGQSKYTLTSFKDNAIWLHNSDNVPRCNFYGTQYEYWVTVIANESPANVKRFKQIAVSTNAPVSSPEAGDITIEPCGNHPEGMVSLLKEAAFTSVQGKYVADFGRNMTTNSPTPTLDDLINGDDLEGQAMTIKLQGDQTTEHKIFTVEIEEIVNE